MTERLRGLVDPDLGPVEDIERHLDDRIDLSVGAPADDDALIAALDGVDVVFVTSRVAITGRVLRETDLDVVAKFGTGIDNVDLEAAESLGVPVTYTPGLNAMSVAEHALGLLLATAKRITATRDVLRAGGWRDEVEKGRQLHGSTVGIVGYGDVGRRIATLLSGFSPEILAHDPYVDAIEAEPAGASMVGFDDLLRESDAVFVSADLTDETRGLFGERAFGLMEEHAFLVNAARGPIVDEAALVEAIRAGEIAGAGLDVYEDEPLDPGSPLHDLEEIVTTPHTAARTVEATERAVAALAENALALLDGEPIPSRYDAIERETSRRNERRRRG